MKSTLNFSSVLTLLEELDEKNALETTLIKEERDSAIALLRLEHPCLKFLIRWAHTLGTINTPADPEEGINLMREEYNRLNK